MKYEECKKAFCSKVQKMSGARSVYDVFIDFCHLARLSLANIFHDQKMDEEYRQILSKYGDNVEPFAELLSIAVDAYEDKIRDFLGECYHELGIENKHAGQFFTPYDVSYCMAKVTIQKDKVMQEIEKQGYTSIADEACGAGCTLLAGVAVLKEIGVNFQKHALIIAKDVDDNCASMCFVQLSLLGVPAIVITGNSLYNDEQKRFYTMFYWLNKHKYTAREAMQRALSLEAES